MLLPLFYTMDLLKTIILKCRIASGDYNSRVFQQFTC